MAEMLRSPTSTGSATSISGERSTKTAT